MCFFFISPELLIFKLLNFELLYFLSLEKKILKVKILFFVITLAPTHNQSSWLESQESHTRLGFWQWLWFEPGDGRNPIKMQPTPLRGQYKTRTGWNHFPNFFLYTELRCCFSQSQHSDPPKYPVCWVQQSSCSGMLLLFWENNTANCLD